MRSESTSAFGQPRETKEMRGGRDDIGPACHAAAAPARERRGKVAWRQPSAALGPAHRQIGVRAMRMRIRALALLLAAALGGPALAQSPPRTVTDYANAMNAIAARLDLQVS